MSLGHLSQGQDGRHGAAVSPWQPPICTARTSAPRLLRAWCLGHAGTESVSNRKTRAAVCHPSKAPPPPSRWPPKLGAPGLGNQGFDVRWDTDVHLRREGPDASKDGGRVPAGSGGRGARQGTPRTPRERLRCPPGRGHAPGGGVPQTSLPPLTAGRRGSARRPHVTRALRGAPEPGRPGVLCHAAQTSHFRS